MRRNCFLCRLLGWWHGTVDGASLQTRLRRRRMENETPRRAKWLFAFQRGGCVPWAHGTSLAGATRSCRSMYLSKAVAGSQPPTADPMNANSVISQRELGQLEVLGLSSDSHPLFHHGSGKNVRCRAWPMQKMEVRKERAGCRCSQ